MFEKKEISDPLETWEMVSRLDRSFEWMGMTFRVSISLKRNSRTRVLKWDALVNPPNDFSELAQLSPEISDLLARDVLPFNEKFLIVKSLNPAEISPAALRLYLKSQTWPSPEASPEST